MHIKLERFISRDIIKFFSKELDMSGTRISVNSLISIMLFSGILATLSIVLILFFALHYSILLILIGTGIAGFFSSIPISPNSNLIDS